MGLLSQAVGRNLLASALSAEQRRPQTVLAAATVVVATYSARKALQRVVLRWHRQVLVALPPLIKIGGVAALCELGRRRRYDVLGALFGGAAAIVLWAQTLQLQFSPPDAKAWRRLSQQRLLEKKLPSEADAIVIGSGAGGLTCAAVLACLGRRVVVLERHPDRSGGGTHMYDLKGFEFDSGFHYGPAMQEYTTWWATQSTVAPPVAFDALVNRHDGAFDYVAVKDHRRGGKDITLPYLPGERHVSAIFAQYARDPAGLQALREYYYRSTKGMVLFGLWGCMALLPHRSLTARLLRALLRFLGWQELAGETAQQAFEGCGVTDPTMQALLNGIWENQGTPPWRCSFPMSVGVVRAFAHVLPSYPRGGSQAIARWLAHTVESAGGAVLHRADVRRILTETDASGKVTAKGVELASGGVIRSEAVVAACGYVNSVKLLEEGTASAAGLPRDLVHLGVRQSPGFVMVNAGFRGTRAECGLDDGPFCEDHHGSTNLWYHPLHGSSYFSDLQEFMEDPLKHEDLPMMCTFPSEKDTTARVRFPTATSLQILIPAEISPFLKWAERPHQNRGADYEALKKEFADRSLRVLYRYYPRLASRVDYVDVSTPLSALHWLGSHRGSAVGLEMSPARLTSDEVGDLLDFAPRGGAIRGLWLCGQDQFCCGVPLAQVSGFACALQMVRLRESLGFLLRCARLTLKGLLPWSASAWAPAPDASGSAPPAFPEQVLK